MNVITLLKFIHKYFQSLVKLQHHVQNLETLYFFFVLFLDIV